MYSKETQIALLNHRLRLLNARDPGVNVNLIRKIKRRLRKLES